MESKYDEKRIKANILSLLFAKEKPYTPLLLFHLSFISLDAFHWQKSMLPTYLVLCCFG